MIKVATLMAVYRGDSPQAFQAAAQSILEQDFSTPIESRVYLAVDGPVPGELEQAIKTVEGAFHRVLWIEKNGGLANALNQLILSLEDEALVFRMDADDVSEPNRYQAQIDFMAQHPNIDIVGTDILEVDAATGETRVVAFSRGPEQARQRLLWRSPVAHPTVCFRRNVLDTVKGYPIVHFNEDIALWFLCAEKGFSFDNVPEPLYRFKIDNSFWKRRSLTKAVSEWRCYIKGGWRLGGLSWRILLPTARLIMRLGPVWVQKWAYKSKFRRP